MKVFEVEQGSPAWHACRAGVLTASNVSVARERLKSGPNKGELTAAARKLAFRIAIERVCECPLQDDKFETYAMRRGHELEPEARSCHEALGVVVRRAGFVTTDDGRLGASVDGFIDPSGAAEYKCLTGPDSLMPIWLEGDFSEFMDQMQTGLYVTGREFFHFGLYCPFMPEGSPFRFTLQLVKRDPVWVAAMKTDIAQFLAVVDQYEAQLRARGVILEAQAARALETI